jgi:membrane dipeptidase
MRTSALLSGLALAVLPALSASPEGTTSRRAHALHFGSIVIDTHDDTTQRLLDPAFDLGARHADGGIDIPRMRQGGLRALFFSIWLPGTVTGPTAVEGALAQIEAVRRQARLHPRDLVLATTAADIRRAAAHHKIAALMGIEGGHMINEDLSTLDRFFALGVRYLTLTHSLNVTWADSSGEAPTHNGLTDFGRTVVAEMNRLGMIVDISHVSDKTFYDVLATSQAPVIASHSSCRALCDAPRNLTDQMIRDLAARGGVIQINFYNAFLSQPFKDAGSAQDGRIGKEIEALIKARCGGDAACGEREWLRLEREYMETGKLPRVDWTAIVEHIDHAVQLVGADHVGLGSDFDGATMPIGMEDASHLPQITEALLEKGYSERDIRNILGGNMLRVLQQVESTAKRMRQSQKGAGR